MYSIEDADCAPPAQDTVVCKGICKMFLLPAFSMPGSLESNAFLVFDNIFFLSNASPAFRLRVRWRYAEEEILWERGCIDTTTISCCLVAADYVRLLTGSSRHMITPAGFRAGSRLGTIQGDESCSSTSYTTMYNIAEYQ